MPMSRSSMGMHALPRLPVPAATGAEFEYRATSACPPCCAMRTWHPAGGAIAEELYEGCEEGSQNAEYSAWTW
jgi:hypothetical protein